MNVQRVMLEAADLLLIARTRDLDFGADRPNRLACAIADLPPDEIEAVLMTVSMLAADLIAGLTERIAEGRVEPDHLLWQMVTQALDRMSD